MLGHPFSEAARVREKLHASKSMTPVLEPDAEELERGARENSERSSCFLMATAERILLGHRPEHLNGHGEHTNGPG